MTSPALTNDLPIRIRHDVDTLRSDLRTLQGDLREGLASVRGDLRALRRDTSTELRHRAETIPPTTVLLAVTAGLGLGLAVWAGLRRRHV